MPTKLEDVYDVFLSKAQDDMYMELTKEDTMRMLDELLQSALHWFEFPRKVINIEEDSFNRELTNEEVNILATYMVCEWLKQQLASIENTRMKYSGTDFKFTSQANHMAKVQALVTKFEEEGFHLQRLYKRREVDDEGNVKSTFGSLMETSVQ